MIFLGAGASKSLGIPTLQEFSEYVFNELKKRARARAAHTHTRERAKKIGEAIILCEK